ncbi:aspartate--ammonia ligase [Bacillus cereus]|uniref:Aspartate--ammonia ligase n=1 Tax=Bacillus cereus TaxID=1396 RepID=A0A9X6X116_BACCE|nr:aspartate--ammonia ligase [Bacillus cereus]
MLVALYIHAVFFYCSYIVFGQLMTGPQLLAHLAQIHIWFKEYGVNIKE